MTTEVTEDQDPLSWDGAFVLTDEFKHTSYYRFAIKEFDKTYPRRPVAEGDVDLQQMILQNVMELLQVFETQGHSGYSASYALNVFNKVVNFQSIIGE